MTGNSLDQHMQRYAQRTVGHASLGHPGTVRRRQPSRGGLAGRRHAVPEVAAAGVVGRGGRRPGRRGRPGRPAVRVRPGHPAAAGADLPGDGARGHQGPPGRRHGHRRLADGAGPDHPDLHRPGRRHPGRGAVLRRCAGHLPVLPGAGRARRDGRRRADPRGTRRRHRDLSGGRPTDQAALHDPELPQPGRRHPVRRPARSSSPRSAAAPASPSSRTTLTGYWVSTTSCAERSAPTMPTTSSTSVRSPRPSRRACGSGGCSRRTPSGRSWCWPTRPPH